MSICFHSETSKCSKDFGDPTLYRRLFCREQEPEIKFQKIGEFPQIRSLLLAS